MVGAGVLTVTGVVTRCVERANSDSRGRSASLSIREQDGRTIELDHVALDNLVRPALAVGAVGRFHFGLYRPTRLHFLLACETEAGARTFAPVSGAYLLGLMIALISANAVVIPASLVILERFFISPLSGLVFVCAYLAALGYGLYAVAEIAALHLRARRLRRSLIASI